MFHELSIIRGQLKKCVRCGQCRSVCPIFKEIGTETAAPRGHVFLALMLRDGELDPSVKIAERANRCLLCESCSSDCPSGIKVHEIVAATRDYLAGYQPKPVKRRLLRSVWAKPSRLKWAHRLARNYQSTGLQKLSRKTGLIKFLAGDLAPAEGLLGRVPPQTALSMIGRHQPAQGLRKLKVGYFLGCATNMFSPEVAQAAVEVLTRNNCEVVIPEGLKCCGLPHYANSEGELAKTLARENIELFLQAEVDAIVTDCASCSSTLKGPLYTEWSEPEFAEEAKAFQDKIYDLNVFLTEQIELDQNFGEIPAATVTYHDPCHLKKAQKITTQPRKLLQLIPGVEFQEMEGADQCCGGAGTFSFFNYDLSMKILDRKISYVQQTRADILATSCPACTMQLKHGFERQRLDCQVVHPVELLAEAYRQADRKA